MMPAIPTPKTNTHIANLLLILSPNPVLELKRLWGECAVM